MTRVLLAAFLAVVSLGCGAGGPSGGPARGAEAASAPSPFPTRDELQTIALKPAPKATVSGDVAPVDRWTPKGPLPSVIGSLPRSAATPIEAVLAEAAADPKLKLTMTEALACAAREISWFALEEHGNPSDPLRTRILGRCGAADPRHGVYTLGFDVPDKVTDAEVLSQVRDKVREMIRKSPADVPRAAGIAFERKDGHALIALVVQAIEVEVEPVAVVPEDRSHAHIRGKVMVPVGHLAGFATHGEFGVVPCAMDPAVKLPAFHVTCDVTPQDAAAWVDVMIYPPGRLLGFSLVSMRLFPGGAPETEIVVPGMDKNQTSDPEAWPGEVLAELNRVRALGGLHPLSLEARQSATMTSLLPHFVAATEGALDPEIADKVALGVQAGWDVNAVVHSGRLAIQGVNGATHPLTALRVALDDAVGRWTLLDPEADRFALGALSVSDPTFMQTFFTTYDVVDASSALRDAEAVAQRIQALRTSLGHRPARPLLALRALAEQAAKDVTEGRATPNDAMDRLLESSAETLQGPVQGWLGHLSAIGQLDIPPELVSRPELSMMLSVGYERRPGEPWVRITLFIVAPAAPNAGMVKGPEPREPRQMAMVTSATASR